MAVKSFGERIAEMLIEDGLLLPAQYDQALDLQRKGGGKLLKILTEKQFVSEPEMILSMSRCLDTPVVNLPKVRVPEAVQALVPRDLCTAHRLVPVALVGRRLYVAMADPLNVLALDDIRHRTRLDVFPMIATERSVMESISGASTGGSAMDEVIRAAADETGAIEIADRIDEVDLDRAVESDADAPVVKIVNLILMQALREKASDIHIEPFEKTMKLRYRVDGNLTDASSPPKALQQLITSRIKILSGLDISERRLPQDGRFRIRLTGREIDLRISMIPTIYGEKIVIRLLDKGTVGGNVDQLGMDERTLLRFRKAMDAPHGMLLMTGPTGSGKTTTLYTVLRELNAAEYNIVTVEDPIEYQLTGVNQVAVKPEIGLTFASSLRAILRQDPDIIMIGEIRDNETADIAVKAALTGHQVLSTLHTNDAAGAVTRLDDMGVEPFLISSSVLLTCAQRLIRRICLNCREETAPSQELLDHFTGAGLDATTLWQGSGCDRCKNRGYLGRSAILEVLPITEPIRRLILKRASAGVIKNQAVTEGMKTLRSAGIDKAREGVTTLEEVWRVTAEE